MVGKPNLKNILTVNSQFIHSQKVNNLTVNKKISELTQRNGDFKLTINMKIT